MLQREGRHCRVLAVGTHAHVQCKLPGCKYLWDVSFHSLSIFMVGDLPYKAIGHPRSKSRVERRRRIVNFELQHSILIQGDIGGVVQG